MEEKKCDDRSLLDFNDNKQNILNSINSNNNQNQTGNSIVGIQNLNKGILQSNKSKTPDITSSKQRDLQPENKKTSKYENFLSEIDQQSSSYNNNNNFSTTKNSKPNSSNLGFNFQNSNKNELSSVFSVNNDIDNLSKLNSQRKTKSFLSKGEEKDLNMEQRKNEKKAILLDMLSGQQHNNEKNKLLITNTSSGVIFNSNVDNTSSRIENSNKIGNSNSTNRVRSQIKSIV